MKHSLFIFFFTTLIASAQVVTFGVKAGIPLSTAPFNVGPTDTGRWTVGPTIEGHITRNFSIELDALYRGYNRAGAGIYPPSLGNGAYSYHYETKAWDVPILLKYRFGKSRARPFIDAGLDYTHESVDVSISCFGPVCNSLSFPLLPELVGRSTVQANRWGVVGGAGVEFRLWKMKIAPEFRYTRLNNPGGNQSTLLVGFTF